MKKVIVLLLVFVSLQLLLAETAEVKRERAILREGPGAIYAVLAELAQGSRLEILQETQGWYQVEVEDLNGYVSIKVTSERQQADDVFARMSTQQTTERVSQHGMSAGVKGFAERFTKSFQGDPGFLETYLALQIDPAGYGFFKEQTYRSRDLQAVSSYPLPPVLVKDYYSASEEGIGLAIAAQISSLGLLNNPGFSQYLNYVGNLVAENADAYDIGYRFFIIDSDKVNAYACPGGTIFITRGMLLSLLNEAELAAVLAHEIAHVARHHGMIEMAKRKHHIGAENAFAEMDDEMEMAGMDYPDEAKEIEQEMEELAFETFETIIAGRLREYEEEADRLALLYTLRTGYDYTALHNLLLRLQRDQSESTNEHYSQEQIGERLILVKSALEEIKLPPEIQLMQQQERWLGWKKSLLRDND